MTADFIKRIGFDLIVIVFLSNFNYLFIFFKGIARYIIVIFEYFPLPLI